MTQRDMFSIFIHEAVSCMPSLPTYPSIMNSGDIGIAIEVGVEDL
jgi:hypothetical protein